MPQGFPLSFFNLLGHKVGSVLLALQLPILVIFFHSLLAEHSVCIAHLNKRLKSEKDISLINILTYPVAM